MGWYNGGTWENLSSRHLVHIVKELMWAVNQRREALALDPQDFIYEIGGATANYPTTSQLNKLPINGDEMKSNYDLMKLGITSMLNLWNSGFQGGIGFVPDDSLTGPFYDWYDNPFYYQSALTLAHGALITTPENLIEIEWAIRMQNWLSDMRYLVIMPERIVVEGGSIDKTGYGAPRTSDPDDGGWYDAMACGSISGLGSCDNGDGGLDVGWVLATTGGGFGYTGIKNAGAWDYDLSMFGGTVLASYASVNGSPASSLGISADFNGVSYSSGSLLTAAYDVFPDLDNYSHTLTVTTSLPGSNPFPYPTPPGQNASNGIFVSDEQVLVDLQSVCDDLQ